MYAHKKDSHDELHEPGDWTPISTKPTEWAEPVPYGITLVCKCGDIIALKHAVHTILDKAGVLDVSPSIAHLNTGVTTPYRCHYFIKDGEYVQA